MKRLYHTEVWYGRFLLYPLEGGESDVLIAVIIIVTTNHFFIHSMPSWHVAYIAVKHAVKRYVFSLLWWHAQRRHGYPERDELRAKFTRWLETIIKRAKIDYLRKYENRPEIISYEDIPESELIDLTQCELWPSSTRMQTPYDFEEERLTKAFMELPLKRRQVMELLFLADLSEAETAKRLNCSLQYVRNQRCIALKKLRSRLMEGGDDE